MTEQLVSEEILRTAIECKFLKKKVTKEAVMKLHSVMVDADIASGIIVCKTGFTQDTLIYAEYIGIRLVQLNEVGKENVDGEHDINIGILDIHNQITITRPKIINIDFGSIQITEEDEIMLMYYSNYARIINSDGTETPFTKYLNSYFDELHRQNQHLKTITINHKPLRGKLIRMDHYNKLDIEEISFTGFLCKIDATSNRSFQLVDQVWMVMKEIFEKKGYKLSKGGIIFMDLDE